MTPIASRLRQAREAAGLEPRGLDAAAELTPGHTRAIESGARVHLAVETVRRLASALNVSLDWLVTGVECTAPAKPARRRRTG